jgi:hypothetical protein
MFVNTNKDKVNENGLYIVSAQDFLEQVKNLEDLINIAKQNASLPREKFDSLMAWVCTVNNWLAYFLKV